MNLSEVKLIQMPKIPDERGNLSFFENENQVPFIISRVYWIYDIPAGETRDGYACKYRQEFIIALSGSFNVSVSDGVNEKTYILSRPDMGLLIPPMIWRKIENFATNSLALAAVSGENALPEMIDDFDAFKKMANG